MASAPPAAHADGSAHHDVEPSDVLATPRDSGYPVDVDYPVGFG